MQGIAISTDRIAAAGTGVTDVGAGLTTEIATMEDLLAQIGAGWRSDSAAPQFAVRMREYLAEAVVLKDALISHGATLVLTGRRFAEAETAVAQQVAGTYR
jgi:uncharacterized protein YukE